MTTPISNPRFVYFSPLVLLFILYPFDRFSLVSFFSITDLLILMLPIVFGVYILKNRQIEYSSIAIIIGLCFAGLIIAGTVSLFASSRVDLQAIQFIYKFALILILHVAILTFIKRRDQIRLLLKIVIISAVVINIINILQGYTIITLESSRFATSRSIAGFQFPVTRRAVAIFTIFASYGIWSLIGFVFSMVSISEGEIVKRPFAIVSALIIAFGNIFVLQSRNVIVAFCASFFLYMWIISLKSNLNRWIKRLIWFIPFVGLVLTPVVLHVLVAVNPRTVNQRIYQYQVAYDIFRNNPLFGVPLGQVQDVTGHTLHSLYLQLITYGGLLGFFPFVVAMVLLARLFISTIVTSIDTHLTTGFFCVLIGTLAISLTYPGAKDYLPWLVISLGTAHLSISLKGGSPYDRT